ncbi:MAG TPA: hypothetical protein VKU82_05150 [Planctomycetaceae bacterium]|nr:hypothetical protein [Planctomycetaceae bacterium]
MNLCIGPEGQIFTAESEGIIRRFSASGEAMGMVGKVTLSGGCKNVAVAVSPDGENVYFCDLPGSRIIVLGRITDEEEAEALTKKLNKQAPPVVQEAEEDAEDAASQSTGESE